MRKKAAIEISPIVVFRFCQKPLKATHRENSLDSIVTLVTVVPGTPCYFRTRFNLTISASVVILLRARITSRGRRLARCWLLARDECFSFRFLGTSKLFELLFMIPFTLPALRLTQRRPVSPQTPSQDRVPLVFPGKPVRLVTVFSPVMI